MEDDKRMRGAVADKREEGTVIGSYSRFSPLAATDAAFPSCHRRWLWRWGGSKRKDARKEEREGRMAQAPRALLHDTGVTSSCAWWRRHRPLFSRSELEKHDTVRKRDRVTLLHACAAHAIRERWDGMDQSATCSLDKANPDIYIIFFLTQPPMKSFNQIYFKSMKSCKQCSQSGDVRRQGRARTECLPNSILIWSGHSGQLRPRLTIFWISVLPIFIVLRSWGAFF